MDDKQLDHEYALLMQQEHALLEQLLTTITTALSSEPNGRQQIVSLLSELVDLTESHFAHEENGGFMSEAVVQAPRLATQVETIRREHELLLEDVQKIQLLASSSLESESWWNNIRTHFSEFSARMRKHEAAEKSILQDAFTDDLGTGD